MHSTVFNSLWKFQVIQSILMSIDSLILDDDQNRISKKCIEYGRPGANYLSSERLQ